MDTTWLVFGTLMGGGLIGSLLTKQLKRALSPLSRNPWRLVSTKKSKLSEAI
jgi:hypothetical protein